MLFSSGLFWALFLVFLPVYALLKRRLWQMLLFVTVFSLYFYYKSSGVFFLLLSATSLLDWTLSKLLVELREKWQRQACVWLSVVCSLGILGYFKYANFFLWNWNAMLEGNFQPLDIILPVGISFYTFQSISYIVDVYKGRVAPTETWLEYVFFLSFFPALVAGPIVRADYFIPQIRANRRATTDETYAGLWLIIVGVVKKALIADYISQYNDLIFLSPTGYSGFESLMGVIGYTMQIYCDFSGYSDMAIGLALLLGYRFMDNFDSPFKAQSPTEFWHRWHISLATWLRDYVYIPLGGNRCSKARSNFNQMATMVIGGLWHGASWMYVIWGALHGAMLVIHKTLRRWFPSTPGAATPAWRRFLNIFVTFNLVVFIFMFFRSQSMDHVGQMTGQIVNDFHLSVAPQFISGYFLIVLAMVAGYAMHFSPKSWTQWIKYQWGRMHPIVQAVVLALVLLLIIQVRQSDIVPFIYLQY